MKSEPLSFAAVSALLSYCPETGELTWRRSRRGVSAGSRAGCTAGDGYIVVRILGRSYAGHRVAWLLATGSWPKHQIDHVDCDRANNRRVNLRDVTDGVNKQNRRGALSTSGTGLLGASFDRWSGRFVSRIGVGEKHLNLGRFDSPEAAHEAYVAAKRRLHVGCTL